MVFFIPILLVVAGVAIYKEAKGRKLKKQGLKNEADGQSSTESKFRFKSKSKSRSKSASKGHGTVYYNEAAIDTKMQDVNEQEKAPPVYQQYSEAYTTPPPYAATTGSQSLSIVA